MSIASTDCQNVSIGEFSCASCLHSRAQLSIDAADVDLMCSKTGERAESRCDLFVYEPGTDEDENREVE